MFKTNKKDSFTLRLDLIKHADKHFPLKYCLQTLVMIVEVASEQGLVQQPFLMCL